MPTDKGAPLITDGKSNDVPVDINAVSQWASDNLPRAMTTVERDALSAAALWDGRLIWNKTTARPEQFDADGSVWRPAALTEALANLAYARLASGLNRFTGYADWFRGALAQTPNVIDVLGLVAVTTGDGELSLRSRVVRLVSGNTHAGAVLDLFRFGDPGAQMVLRWHRNALLVLGGRLVADEGVESARMRHASDFVSAEESTTNTAWEFLPTFGPSVDVVCPPSGRFTVHLGAVGIQGGSGEALMGFQVLDMANGFAVAVPMDENRAVSFSSLATFTSSYIVSDISGLVPGRQYRLEAVYRSTTGAQSRFRWRRIVVIPSP